jgi:hypothetical protein
MFLHMILLAFCWEASITPVPAFLSRLAQRLPSSQFSPDAQFIDDGSL